ncbi:MAG: KEOPS complex subunit Pcc1 [Haloferacaceae archaeon]
MPDAARSHDATLSFGYDDERRARTVADAVAVEAGAIAAVDDRSRAAVERDGSLVRVRVDAADLVALRAACNTWTRLVGVAEDVADG